MYSIDELLKDLSKDGTININDSNINRFENNEIIINDVDLQDYHLIISELHNNIKIKISITDSFFKKISIKNIESELDINIYNSGKSELINDISLYYLRNEKNILKISHINFKNSSSLIDASKFYEVNLFYINFVYTYYSTSVLFYFIDNSEVNQFKVIGSNFKSNIKQNLIFQNLEIVSCQFKNNVLLDIGYNKPNHQINGISIKESIFDKRFEINDDFENKNISDDIESIHISNCEIRNDSLIRIKNKTVKRFCFVFDTNKKYSLITDISNLSILELMGDFNSDNNNKLKILIDKLKKLEINNFRNYGRIEFSIKVLTNKLNINNAELGDISFINFSIEDLQEFQVINSSLNELKFHTVIWGESILKLNNREIGNKIEALENYYGAKNLRMAIESNNDLTAKDYAIQREYELFQKYIESKNANLSYFKRKFHKDQLILYFGKINDFGRDYTKPLIWFVFGNMALALILTILYYFFSSLFILNYSQKGSFFQTAIKFLELQISPFTSFGKYTPETSKVIYFFTFPIVLLIKAINIILIYQIVEAFRKFSRKK